jgi:hypothetical protein
MRQVVGRIFARLRPWSRHRLGPSDMSFEAKRFRHVAVAIREVCISRGIAVSPRQESPQPQQPDVAYHQTLIGWRGGKPQSRSGIASDEIGCGDGGPVCGIARGGVYGVVDGGGT